MVSLVWFVHLSCKISVAERQGRSSRVWRSSTAVPAVTREGSRSTKSSTTAGLSHANNYRDRQRNTKQRVCVSPAWYNMYCSLAYNVIHATVGMYSVNSSQEDLCMDSLVFTFSRFGKEWVYCGTRSCRLSTFSRRKRRSSCARKWSLNSSAGNRPNTRFHTLSQSTAAISPKQVQAHVYFKLQMLWVFVNQGAELSA